MKILYIGTVCNIDEYEEFLDGCNCVPSKASIIFENSLLNGFAKNDVELCIYSYPMIPTFPKCKHLYWGNIEQQLNSGYICTWLKTINIPIVKQISRRIDGRKMIKKWLEKNKGNECALISYSIPPFLVKDILSLCKKYNVASYAIVPDLLQDMYKNHNTNKFVTMIRNCYLKSAKSVQGNFDGYVYLTKSMSDVINREKPYIVIESVADLSMYKLNDNNQSPKTKFIIMYAGGLHIKYGLLNLIEAFERIESDDVELWLFGRGSAEEIIKQRMNVNHKIKYYGNVNRDDVLMYEKRASLLINPRGVNDKYTEYSFPSKIIEYMLSGTPVLTTRLSGIPEEYYDYLIVANSNEVESLKNGINEVMKMSIDERTKFGHAAKNFVINNKNAEIQVKKLMYFIYKNNEQYNFTSNDKIGDNLNLK